MKGNRPKGSFGIPKELMEEIDKNNDKPEGDHNQVTNDIEETVKENKKKETEETEEEEIKIPENGEVTDALLDAIAEDFKIKTEEDDLHDLLFNNSVIKRGVQIFPNLVHASFRYGLTVNEIAEINKKMEIEKKKKELSNQGLDALKTRYLLSYALLELGKPDNLKPIGNTPEERFEEIGNFNGILAEMLVKKWNLFIFLYDNLAKKGSTLKK
jgi:hypothetical protein